MQLVLALHLIACQRDAREQSEPASSIVGDTGPVEDDTDAGPVEPALPARDGSAAELFHGLDELQAGEPESKEPAVCAEAPLAPLAELSTGECPDLSRAGTSSFVSGGSERTVTVVFPTTRGPAPPVIFFFHGLSSTSASSPGAALVGSLALEDVANDLGAVVVVPDATWRTVGELSGWLWDVESFTGEDLVLFDDLRTCLASELDVDLERLFAVGFSGGGLFVTELLRYRSDALAGAVELSGGSDVTVEGYGEVLAPYGAPARSVPTLLISGGELDQWPDEEDPLIDFQTASDTLTDALLADGCAVARCQHADGHTLTWDSYELAQDWVRAHTYGESSPYAAEGMGEDAGWCAWRSE